MGVTLARIVRPHGRRGEVAAEILSDFPERLPALREAYLAGGGCEPRRIAIRSCWLHKQQVIFHFEGSESISDAERLRGLEVQIPLAERMPLPAGRYYITDLIGCEIWQRDGSRLGRVRDVQFLGEGVASAPLLVVESPEGELLIPLAKEICTRIDLAARRIEVVLPDGLRELNLG
ncbi:MAG TPA: ribosome maturation factor RimM [Candidatus Acidoferrales bacterium]|nr:ribosome maturation factor RimM [Candidatus Acidoferrales bacterium]